MENRAQTYRRLGQEYDASRNKRLVSDESLEEGGADKNFVNYQSPAIENHDVI